MRLNAPAQWNGCAHGPAGTASHDLQDRRGYLEIATPIVVSERLLRQSGQWDLYKEHMFLVESENQTFSLKPMNCPESTFVYPIGLGDRGRLRRRVPLRPRADRRAPGAPARPGDLRGIGEQDARAGPAAGWIAAPPVLVDGITDAKLAADH